MGHGTHRTTNHGNCETMAWYQLQALLHSLISHEAPKKAGSLLFWSFLLMPAKLRIGLENPAAGTLSTEACWAPHTRQPRLLATSDCSNIGLFVEVLAKRPEALVLRMTSFWNFAAVAVAFLMAVANLSAKPRQASNLGHDTHARRSWRFLILL